MVSTSPFSHWKSSEVVSRPSMVVTMLLPRTSSVAEVCQARSRIPRRRPWVHYRVRSSRMLPCLRGEREGSAMDVVAPLDRYGDVLAGYLQDPGEQALYDASLLSQDLVQLGVGPEEIVALHMEALDQALEGFTPREQARCVGHAHQFLLEVMIAY